MKRHLVIESERSENQKNNRFEPEFSICPSFGVQECKMKEMLGGCCVCADENGWTDNPLIYCDGPNCEVAVHQGCYGIQEVPDGEWLCARCSASSSTSHQETENVNGDVNGDDDTLNGRRSFRCVLCPSSYGAFKKTDQNGWAHVICALYIPEVRFGDVHSMDPVILSDVPNERFEKLCYLCEANGSRKNAKLGACMSCNKPGCKRGFHVTCAQLKGLLCEEGGGSKNVKYCGYCDNHLRKAQQDPSIKVIPAVRITRLVHRPTPPLSSESSDQQHMLVDPLPRVEQVNNVHGFSAPGTVSSSSAVAEDVLTSSASHHQNFGTTFSPPLTTSSRSSVVLETTPPLGTSSAIAAVASSSSAIFTAPIPSTYLTSVTTSLTNGSVSHVVDSTTSVGTHLQQQLQLQNSASYNTNGTTNYSSIVSAALNQELTNHNRLPLGMAGLLPADFAHLNGGAELEEKTVKAVLTAPLVSNKGKRAREIKEYDKVPKRSRINNRTAAAAAAAAAHAKTDRNSMQRLINLVAPVVSETVSDFQRDRVADRTAAAERRAASSMATPSTSSAAAQQDIKDVKDIQLTHNNTSPSNNSINGPTTSTPTSSRISATATLPSSMEQLLERQWEQGSQFLMSQAHFDVAQLLTCLHQLKSENIRLEDQLVLLTKRREHLMALNQRLSQPLGPPLPKPQHHQQPQQVHSTSTASTSGVSDAVVQQHPPHHSVVSPHHSPHVSVSMPQPDDSMNQLRSLTIGNGLRPVVALAAPVASTPSTSVAQASHMTSQSSIPISSIRAPVSSTSFTTPQQQRTATPTSAASMVPSTSTTIQTPNLSTTPATSLATSIASVADLANLSPERLAQLTAASPLLNSVYRNQLQFNDPAVLSLLLSNPGYLNQNMFSRLVSNPQLAAVASAIAASAGQTIHPNGAASNGKQL
ncbi:unnamed protein product [Caenorhabditis auriculariae]|uniref:Protein AF-10 n=1 Tax=Caenorhabditis auriculariae TaxID=2777116 RepID=A0A8S1GSI2_9PELO|nr:unnamed protein product [Caenorhabditis auriculariae]